MTNMEIETKADLDALKDIIALRAMRAELGKDLADAEKLLKASIKEAGAVAATVNGERVVGWDQAATKDVLNIKELLSSVSAGLITKHTHPKVGRKAFNLADNAEEILAERVTSALVDLH